MLATDAAVAAAQLAGAADGDLAVVLPVGNGLASLDDAAIAETIGLFEGGIAVGAATAALGPDDGFIAALEEQLGGRPSRCHLHPGAFAGPAPAVRALLEDLASRDGTPLARLLEAFGDGTHDLVLDIAGQVVRVLDGTGTDVVAVDGGFAAGPERPVAVVGAPEELAALRDAWDIAMTTPPVGR